MSGKKRTKMGTMIDIWHNVTNGKSLQLSSKERENAINKTMNIFAKQENARKGANLFSRALRGKGKKKTKRRKIKKKGGKRKSMKSNKRSRRKRRGSKKRR